MTFNEVEQFADLMIEKKIRVLKNGGLILEIDQQSLSQDFTGPLEIEQPKIKREPDKEGDDDLYYSEG